jgi:hypothetical protein
VEREPAIKRNASTGEVMARGTMTLRPCEYCNPIGYEKWKADLPKRQAAHLRNSPPDLLDFNPRVVLDQAAAALASHPVET